MNPTQPANEPSLAWKSTRFVVTIGLLALVIVLMGGECFNTRGRILAKAKAPNGVEIYVVQRFTKDPELYNTSFYCRRPDGVWGWGYVDHQDDFWPAWRASVQVDTNRGQIMVFRAGKQLLHYNWRRDEYVLDTRTSMSSSGTNLWQPTISTPVWWKPGLLPR